MTDLIKWALLVVIIISVIVTVASFWEEIEGLAVVQQAISIVGSGLAVISPYLKWAREFLNCLLPPKLVSACLIVAFTGFFVRIFTRLSTLIAGFIYK